MTVLWMFLGAWGLAATFLAGFAEWWMDRLGW